MLDRQPPKARIRDRLEEVAAGGSGKTEAKAAGNGKGRRAKKAGAADPPASWPELEAYPKARPPKEVTPQLCTLDDADRTGLVKGEMGIGLCNATLSALISHSADIHEQGRVQGAAGALESIGRASGPVWGNAALQEFGEGSAYGAAAVLLVGAAVVMSRQRQPREGEP